MDKPGTKTTLVTRHRTKINKTKNTTQKTKMMSITDPAKKEIKKKKKKKTTRMNPCAHEGEAVPVSYTF